MIAPAERRRGPPSLSSAVIAETVAAVEEHGIAGAAEALGISKRAVYYRVAGQGVTGHVGHTGRARSPVDPAAAIKAVETHGSWAAAGRALGVSRSTVCARVAEGRRALGLACVGRSRVPYTTAEIVAAVREHGSMRAAARALGVSVGTVFGRVHEVVG